jgi:hypothetical protein
VGKQQADDLTRRKSALAVTGSVERRDRTTVRFDTKDHYGLFFHDQLRCENGSGDIVAHVDDLNLCSATDLLRAMRRSDRFLGTGITTLLVSEVDVDFFDEEESAVAPVSS